tara:strand:+ start:1709 stop:2125 length:417 start_codon:yes stop_codon:yes gene_type:complete
MTPTVEKLIGDYINSPTGTIRTIYPIVDHVDLEYHKNPDEPKVKNRLTVNEWLTVDVYLTSPIEHIHDLWDTHNFDWTYMMDHHITKGIFKLFGVNKLPYEIKIYAPWNEENIHQNFERSFRTNSKWEYIDGTPGLTW